MALISPRSRSATILRAASSRTKSLLSVATLALLALNFLSPALRPAYAFSNGQSMASVLGEPDFTTTINPNGALNTPSNFAFDSSGNLWIADAGNNRVIEESNVGVGQTAAIRVVLGQPNLKVGFPLLTQSGIYNPSGLTTDSSGNLWVTDTSNNRVLEFTAPFSNGEAAAVVLGQANFTSSSLAASQGGLSFPAGVAFDSSGNLWVADSSDNRVVEFKPSFSNGMTPSLVLGQASLGSTFNSTSASGLNFPTSLRFDSSGNLWVADGGNNRILEYKAPFSTGMNATTVIGQPNFTSNSSSATQGGLDSPGSLAFDSSGDLWVADTFNNRVLEYAAPLSSGMQAALTVGQPGFTSSSPAITRTGLSEPTEVAFNKAGDLFVADSSNNRIIEYAPPFRGGDSAVFVLGQNDYVSNLIGGRSSLSFPTSVAFDASGNLWTADASDNRVVEYPAPPSTGENASIAIGQGSLNLGNAGNGRSGLSFPFAAVFDKLGNLWVSDSNNNRILEFSPPFSTGMNATLVIGQASFTTYASASGSTGLYFPAGLAFDSAGNLWVADAGNSRVLEFKAPFSNGMAASLVIGQQNFAISSPGLAANRLYEPFSVTFDSLGDLLVADSGNSRVVGFAAPLTGGESATLVIGQASFTTQAQGDTQTNLHAPEGVAFDRSGNLWVSDTGNDRVLGFGSLLTNGIKASVVLGQGSFTSSVPTTSQTNLIGPQGIAIDSAGNLWVSDASNNRLVDFASSGASTSSTVTISVPSTTATSTSTSTSTTSTSSVTTSSASGTSTSTSSASTTSASTSSTVPEFPWGAPSAFVAAIFLSLLAYALAGKKGTGFDRARNP